MRSCLAPEDGEMTPFPVGLPGGGRPWSLSPVGPGIRVGIVPALERLAVLAVGVFEECAAVRASITVLAVLTDLDLVFPRSPRALKARPGDDIRESDGLVVAE